MKFLLYQHSFPFTDKKLTITLTMNMCFTRSIVLCRKTECASWRSWQERQGEKSILELLSLQIIVTDKSCLAPFVGLNICLETNQQPLSRSKILMVILKAINCTIWYHKNINKGPKYFIIFSSTIERLFLSSPQNILDQKAKNITLIWDDS